MIKRRIRAKTMFLIVLAAIIAMHPVSMGTGDSILRDLPDWKCDASR